MYVDVWYDLMIRELSELSDPGREKLAEAAAVALPVPEVEADEPPAPPAAPIVPPVPGPRRLARS